PAHPGRGDLRDRPVRPGAAAARPAGPADAPPPGLGRDRAGQPVGDDPVPVAPDRVRHGQLPRPAGGPGAGPGARPDGRSGGREPTHRAAGVRGHVVGPVAGVPPGRARLAGSTVHAWRVGAERAETYLRLRAEAELRRVAAELRRADAAAGDAQADPPGTPVTTAEMAHWKAARARPDIRAAGAARPTLPPPAP